jgi:hypothetical protein
MRFFGFGEIMTKMVMTLLKGRISRIILDTGYSDSIMIARGTPQGDRSSPYIFILCMEVLLLKLKIDIEREGVETELFLEWSTNRDINMEPLFGEAYADDLTLVFNMSRENVQNILNILGNFFAISGLSVNTDKTQLMVAGSDQWVEGDSVNGIKIVTSVNILGVTIDRKNENGRQNWDRVISKIERLARYWMMFGLSITGRVFVVKTYLLSQAIYLMNVISLENEHGMRINEIMLNFVKGTDRLIERRRQTLCAELGGYGIVDANVMDLCVKASWVERWKREGRNMDYPAMIMWNGDLELRNKNICKANVRNKGMSMMTVIYEAYKNFKREYIDFGHNINTTELFSNSTIMEGDQYMEEMVFGMGRYMGIRPHLENKLVGDVCNRDGGMVSKEETERVFGVRLNWAEYFRLRVEIERLRVEFVRKVGCPIREINIDEFMLGRKKGIKKYRVDNRG